MHSVFHCLHSCKDKALIVGGIGKEFTMPDGTIAHHNPEYIKRISHLGKSEVELRFSSCGMNHARINECLIMEILLGVVEHINWKENYDAIRLAAGYPYPSYLLHEACNWSEHHKQWFFLPRRASKEPYDADLDENRCANILIRADEKFNDITVTHIGELDITRGYSAFRFIPNTNDNFIIATKTSECPDTRSMKTYVTGKLILAPLYLY